MSRKARAPLPLSDEPSVKGRRTSPGVAERWRALFGSEPPPAAGFIEQAIAWREQVVAEGDVAPAIAHDLAIAARQQRDGEEAEPETAAPRSISPEPDAAPRSRSRAASAPLPPASSQLQPGTQLVKAYGGRNHVVEVTATGFVYEEAEFASLSAIAKHITGTHWNGLLFFGLRRRKTYPPKAAAHG